MDHERRRLPIGAEQHSDGAHFRVWAPRRQRVEVAVERGEAAGRAFPLSAEPGGYFAGFVRGVGAGDRYRFQLDGGERFPDPASRFQPEGPHGPSELVDPDAFPWTDAG